VPLYARSNVRKRSRGCVFVVVGMFALMSCSSSERPATSGRTERPETTVTTEAVIARTFGYQLYTHCGIQWAKIDGSWWRLGPGEAFASVIGNPYEDGTMTVTGSMSAVFTSPAGTVAYEWTGLTDNPAGACL